MDEGKLGHSGGSGIVASIENVARRAVALVSRPSHRKSLVIQSLARLLLPNTRGREGSGYKQQCSPIMNPSFPLKVGARFRSR